MSAGTATTVATPAAAATAAGTPGQAVAVVDPARIAIAAARAVLLEAIVQGRAPDGVVTLKTPQGNVQIRSTTPLPTGATVALELTRTGEQVTARLLPAATLRAPPTTAPTAATPNAQAAMDASMPPSASTTSTPAVRPGGLGGATFGAIALATDAPVPPPIGRTGAAPAPAGAERALSQAPAGTAAISTTASLLPVPARSLLVATPQAPASMLTTPSATPTSTPTAPRIPTSPVPPTPSAPPPPAASSAPAPLASPTVTADAPLATRAAAAALYAQARPSPTSRTTPSAPSQGDGTPPHAESSPAVRTSTSVTARATPAASPSATPATPRLQPGTTLEVRMAQASPQPSSPGTQPAQPLPATVVGAMPQGRLVVDTPVGRLAVSVPPDLLGTPPGDTLSLEWLPESTRAPLSGDGAAPNAQSTRGWPQAREAAATLLARAESGVRDAADQLVPKPGPRLAEQMMGFIGRGDGDVARWLGEAMMRQLEQLGMTGLVQRAEAGATREPDRQPANGDWRHVTMPLFDGTLLRPIEIRARRRNGGQADGGRDQSRFVVDCVHDELGAVQIDGLMTSASAKKRLDIILRSHVELPESDRAALSALFADTCGAMGLGGEIAFQVLAHFPIVADNPLAHRAVIA